MDKDLFRFVCSGKGSCHALGDDPERRPAVEPVRLPGLREAGALCLVGRDHEGRERGRAEDAVELARFYIDEKVLVEEFVDGVEVEACSETATPVASFPGRSCRTGSRASTGTTTRRSTTRAAWT